MSTDIIYGPILNKFEPIDNKYYKWYINICRKKQLERGYIPHHAKPKGIYKHHIIPDSFYIESKRSQRRNVCNGWLFGNPDVKINLVFLTKREHLCCHKLLTKFYEGLAKAKMVYAYLITSSAEKDTLHAKDAASLMQIERTGAKASQETKTKMHLRMLGNTHNKGKKCSPETILKHKTKIPTQATFWLVVTPEGEQKIIFNLAEFCRLNKLDKTCMREIATLKRSMHKNWLCYKVDVILYVLMAVNNGLM